MPVVHSSDFRSVAKQAVKDALLAAPWRITEGQKATILKGVQRD